MTVLTHNAIKQSFLKLLETKSIAKITVRDIVEDCGINRNTFYYHFDSIPALLDEILWDHVREVFSNPNNHTIEEYQDEVIDIFLQNKQIVLNIYNSLNRENMERFLMSLCEYAARKSFSEICEPLGEEKRECIMEVAQCTLFGAIVEWLDKRMESDMHKLNHDVCELLMHSIDFLISEKQKN